MENSISIRYIRAPPEFDVIRSIFRVVLSAVSSLPSCAMSTACSSQRRPWDEKPENTSHGVVTQRSACVNPAHPELKVQALHVETHVVHRNKKVRTSMTSGMKFAQTQKRGKTNGTKEAYLEAVWEIRNYGSPLIRHVAKEHLIKDGDGVRLPERSVHVGHVRRLQGQNYEPLRKGLWTNVSPIDSTLSKIHQARVHVFSDDMAGRLPRKESI